MVIGNSENFNLYKSSDGEKLIVRNINGDYFGMDPDGRHMAVKDHDTGEIKLWSISEKYVVTQNESTPFPAEKVVFSPTGDKLASLENDGEIVLRDTSNGEPIGNPLIATGSDASGRLAFNPDGEVIVYLADQTLYVWKVEDQERLNTPAGIHKRSVSSFLFTDSLSLAIGGTDGRIWLWDDVFNSNAREITSGESEPLKGRITKLTFSPDGERLLSTAGDGIIIMDISDRSSSRKIPELVAGDFQDVNWENSILAVHTAYGIILRNAENNSFIKSIADGQKVIFSTDGNLLAASDANSITLYRITRENGMPILSKVGDPIEEITEESRFLFDPSGNFLAVADNDNQIRLYKTIDAKQVGNTNFVFDTSFNYMVFSPDGKYLYYKDQDGYIDSHNLQTHKENYEKINENIDLNSSLLSSNGEVLITPYKSDVNTDFNNILLWDLNGSSLSKGETLKGSFDSGIVKLKLIGSAASQRLVSLDQDGNIILWNVAKDYTPNVEGMGNLDAVDPILAATTNSDRSLQAVFTKHGIVLQDQNQKEIGPSLNDHILGISAVDFPEGGNTLVATSQQDYTILYNAKTAERVGEAINETFFKSLNDHIVITNKSESNGGGFTVWNLQNDNVKLDFGPKNTFRISSPDGRFLAVGDSAESFTLYDLDAMEKLDAPVQEESFVAFNPALPQIITSGKDSLFLHNIMSGIVVELTGEDSPTFSPDGNFLVTSNDETINLWDAQSGQLLKGPLPGYFVIFGPESRYMAYTASDQIHVLNMTTFEDIGDPIFGNAAEFSPDGKILSISYYDEETSLLDLPTETKIGEALPGVLTSFSVHGSPLVFYDPAEDGFLLVDPEKGRLNKNAIPGNFQMVSPDGRILVTYDDIDDEINLWSMDSGESLVESIPLSGGVFQGFGPDGAMLILQGSDGSANLVDWRSPEEETVPIHADFTVYSMDNTFTYALHSEDNNTLDIWDVNTGEIIKKYDRDVYDGNVTSISVSDKGDRLVIFGDSGIRLLDTIKNEFIGTQKQEVGGLVTQLMLNPQGTYLASAGSDGIIIYNISNPSSVRLVTKIDSHGKDLLAMRFTGENSLRYLFDDGTIEEKDLLTGQVKPVKEITNARHICAQAFSSDGTQFAYQIASGIHVWNQNPDIKQLYKDTENLCNGALTFSPDGKELAYSDGSKIHLWDLESDTLKTEISGSINGQNIVSLAKTMLFVDKEILAIQDAQLSLWDLKRYSIIGAPFDGDLNGIESQPPYLFYRDAQGRIRFLDMSTDIGRYDNWSNFLCGIVGRNLSLAEWDQYFRDEPYPMICPEHPLGPGVELTPIAPR